MTPMLRGSIESARFWLGKTPIRRFAVARRHRGLRRSDCFLASYPKSGNTWLRHLLAYPLTGQETSWRKGMAEYSIIVGRHDELIPVLPNAGRLIKTHEPFLDSYERTVCVVRDPRDVAVSQYFFNRQFSSRRFFQECSFPEFLDVFIKGEACVYGNWADHCRSWIDGSQKSEVLTIKYESLKADTHGCLRQILSFLDVEVSDEIVGKAVAESSAESMRRKEKKYRQANGEEDKTFVRAAKSGGWREHFDDELHDKLKAAFRDVMSAYEYV